MNTIRTMIFVLMAVVFSANPLYSIIYGSVSGVVTEEDTGKAVSGVSIFVSGPSRVTVETDKDGKFLAKPLRPGQYTIMFVPGYPHCNIEPDRIFIEPGENIVFNKVLQIGGTIRGRVLHSGGNAPFPGVSVQAFARFAGSEFDDTREDGSYFLGDGGRLCPSTGYYIKFDCKVPNVAYKVLFGADVAKGTETNIADVVFDLNDPTGIEGYITSSLDGKPLSGVQIAVAHGDKKYPGADEDVKVGDVYTTAAGYYNIKNLEPGNYWIYILPPIDDDWEYDEYSSYCKEKTGIVVVAGKKTRVDAKLDVASASGSTNGG